MLLWSNKLYNISIVCKHKVVLLMRQVFFPFLFSFRSQTSTHQTTGCILWQHFEFMVQPLKYKSLSDKKENTLFPGLHCGQAPNVESNFTTTARILRLTVHCCLIPTMNHFPPVSHSCSTASSALRVAGLPEPLASSLDGVGTGC